MSTEVKVRSGRRRAWDLERRLVRFGALICRTAERLPATRIGNHIATQLIRSGTGVAANYGEAQSAESRKDFIHKMKLCLKELRESRIWLYFIEETELIEPETLAECLAESDELSAIVYTSISTAKHNLTNKSSDR